MRLQKKLTFSAILCCIFFLFLSSAHAEMQIKLLAPARDYTGQERSYFLAASAAVKNATLLRVENDSGDLLYENIPMLVEGGVFAVTQRALSLPLAGTYRFHIGVTAQSEADSGNHTSFFSFTVNSQPAPDVLQNILLSTPPYYANHTFEVLASFAEIPINVKIELVGDTSRQPVEVVYNQGGLEVVGYATPEREGFHEIQISWVSPSTGASYMESLLIYVDLYDRGEGETLVQDRGSSGGGCNAARVSWGVLVLAAGFLLFKDKKRSLLRIVLLAALFGCFIESVGWASVYHVTSEGDDLLNPPVGSLRSILWTIDLLNEQGISTKNAVIQFDSSVSTVVLKEPLELRHEVNLDAYTGRSGKRVVFELEQGGYRHIIAQPGVSANGIVLRGFGKNSAKNIEGKDNGGLHLGGTTALTSLFENCSFIDIVGENAPVVVSPNSFSPLAAPSSTFNLVMDKCLFKGNAAKNGPGALDVVGALQFRETFIGYNRAENNGGALVSWGQTPYPSVYNTIVGNRVGPDSISVPEWLDNSLQGKTLSNDAAFGTVAAKNKVPDYEKRAAPGVSLTVTVQRSNLVGNTTQANGGAARGQYGVLLFNCTLFGNNAGVSDAAISGLDMNSFHASLFADNGLSDDGSVTYDSNGNLVEVTFDPDLGDGKISDIFERSPIDPEDRGGYTPVIPIKYAGPAEGRVFAEMLPQSYLWELAADVRGMPRNPNQGTSIGAYDFGQVSLLPGNIQDSTTIAFKPNDTGSIKVKLLEKLNTSYLSATNYLADIPVEFNLTAGNSLSGLPKTSETADNGRAFVLADTLDSGDSTVRVSVRGKPSVFLDLLIRVGSVAGGGPGGSDPTIPDDTEEDEDLYVVVLDPNNTKTDIANAHIATYSRACVSSTVSIRKKGYKEYIEQNIPVTIKNSIYGTIEKVLSFSQKGSYMFDFKMTDSKGRTYEDTKELKVTDMSLKVFRLSEPPYYEDKTLSLIAMFTKAPREIDMTVIGENDREYKPEMRSQNERLDWEGFFTPAKPGSYKARLEYVDGSNGTMYSEHFTIQVTEYYGDGGTTIIESGGGSGGGCRVSNLNVFPSFFLALIFVNPRRNKR